MEKIKAFFSSKATRITCWVVLALDVTALIIGGATNAEITAGSDLIFAGVAGISALIAFIGERAKNKA